MAEGHRSGAEPRAGRFLLCTGRGEVAEALGAAVDTALEGLEPAGGEPERLVFLDVTDGAVSAREAREALGPGARLVALADGRSVDRLVDALAAGCCDYLFHPPNRSELRLIWRKHAEGEPTPVLPLDRVESGRFHLLFPSEVRYLQPVADRVVEACVEAAAISARHAFRLRVALGEALANAVLHGNREDREARVSVYAMVEGGEMRVAVADEGRGFDPAGVPDPTREENRRRSHGRGLFLLRRLVDRVEFNEVGNRVTLTLDLGSRPDAAEAPVRAGRAREPGGPPGRAADAAETGSESLRPAPAPATADAAGLDALLERCVRATGIPLRVSLRSDGDRRPLHDSLGRAGAAPARLARLEVPTGGGGRLEVEYPEGARGRAAAELAGELAARLLRDHRELRLFSRELVDCYEQIHLLASIGDVLGSVIQVEPAARTILGELVTVLGGGRATLWCFEDAAGALRPFVRRGAADGDGGAAPSARERRLAERAFERQEAELVSAGAEGTAPGSILSVPVTFAPRGGPERRIGVLSVDRGPGEPPLTAGDLRLTEAVASQIGIAIQNGRLLEEGLQRERMVAELDIAHDLQLKLLPNLEGFSDLAEVAARCEPVHQVGGDFYLLIRLHRGRLGVMLGDVSSHGFSAALIMALTMSTAAIYARGREEPAEVLGRIHQQLLRELESTEMYMTLFYGVLDGAEGRMTYANAGHPLAYRVTGDRMERLEALDPPIGMTPPSGYGQARVDWSPGRDLLLLCTDGLAAGLGASAREAEDALARIAGAAGRAGPHAVVEALFERASEREQDDDRSALAVRL